MEDLFAKLDPEIPIMMLPVRIETRFRGTELLVRIYPDDVHQDSHEPKLTFREAEWREHFFEQVKVGNQDAAWNQLVEQFGRQRAFHLIRDNPTVLREDERRPHAGQTSLLPDRWVVMGYTGEARSYQQRFLKWGEVIPQPLKSVPTPGDGPADTLKDWFDDETRWLIDYEEAVKVGMGVRVDLAAKAFQDLFAVGGAIDLLLVFGIKGTVSPEGAEELLEKALEAHTYTWGLDLVRRGNPTNNMEDRSSPYPPPDPTLKWHPDAVKRWILEGTDINRMPSSDPYRLAHMLGIDPQVLYRINTPHLHQHANAREMNTALFPATWGYYLSQMIAVWFNDNNLLFSELEKFRQHFVHNVRAAGPLPSIRIHNQPYGVLPVSSLTRWQAQPIQILRDQRMRDQRVIEVLKELATDWYAAIPAVKFSRTMNSSSERGDNSAHALARVLSTQPSSPSVLKRTTITISQIEALLFAAGMLDDETTRQQLETFREGIYDDVPVIEMVRTLFGTSVPSRLAAAWFEEYATDVDLPLVQAEPRSETDRLVHNYIRELMEKPLTEIADAESDPSSPQTLLYKLLRHSLLLAAVEVASLVPESGERAFRSDVIEPELVDMVPGEPPTLTALRHLLSITVTLPDGTQKLLVDVINEFRLTNVPDPTDYKPLKPLADVHYSLMSLQRLPSAELERLLSETLDLCSHRLDAWITSLFTQRLERIRKAKPQGIQLGGFGWVVNLKPGIDNKLLTQGGYIHAPSTAHATTAALLRSAYLSHQGDALQDLLTIDLSSDRVRRALFLIDGVRSGQPLGALLGYQFERTLDDWWLNRLIADFRNLAPLVAGKQIPATDPVESIAARNVVDGLALLRRWQQAKATNVWNQSTIPDDLRLMPEFASIEELLAQLADSVDAVSDVLTTESVHQGTQGREVRSGASLDALTRGETPPERLEFIQSARSGVGLIHRVLLLMDVDAPQPAGWGASSENVRAAAEPLLNRWLGAFLGDVRRVAASVHYVDSDGQRTTAPALPSVVTLGSLPLSPLDVFYMNVDGDDTLLHQWIIGHLLRAALSAGLALAYVEVDFDNPPDELRDSISFAMLSELLRSARLLIAKCNPLRPDDFTHAAESPVLQCDVDELARRSETAVAKFAEMRMALKTLVEIERTMTSIQAQQGLLWADRFGLPGAIPRHVGNSEEERQSLFSQVKDVVASVDKRWTRVTALRSQPLANDAPVESLLAYYTQTLQTVFGEGFHVLPRWVTDSQDFRRQWDTQPQGVTPASVFEWMTRASRLREPLDYLQTTLLYADALGADQFSDFRVLQLTATPSSNERWVGLNEELPPGQNFPGGRCSLVIHHPRHYEPTGSGQQVVVAGLKIDEWTEVVPNESETTGVSFHYDAPQAAPPQSILLAVHPSPYDDYGKPVIPWDVDTLATVLLETFELMQMRLVTLDDLPDSLGQYLPALLFATATDPTTTVSTEFKAQGGT